MNAKHGENHPEIAEVQRLFIEVGQEMIMHMQKEEQILFLYIDALELSTTGNGSLEPPFFQTVKNPIQAMMKEHDSAGDLVKQIRKASGDYAPPADACTSYNALFSSGCRRGGAGSVETNDGGAGRSGGVDLCDLQNMTIHASAANQS